MVEIGDIVSVDVGAERRIVTAMIVSTRFMREIRPIVESRFFQNSLMKKVADWCIEFYDKYETAPYKKISDIFEIQFLDPSERETMKVMLANMSADYEDKKFDADFYADEAEKYFHKRNLEDKINLAKKAIERGRIDVGEEIIFKYKPVRRAPDKQPALFDKETIISFTEQKLEGEYFLKFEGALGDLIGEIEKGWLVAVMAPAKRGKSWMLQEFAFQAMMDRLNVLFVSLEMSTKQVSNRFYKRMTGLTNDGGGWYIPVWDCYLNQIGTCTKRGRTCDKRLIVEGQIFKPSFKENIDYTACAVCKGTEEWTPETWFAKLESVRKMTTTEVLRQTKMLEEMFGRRLIIRSYPRFSATLDDIKREIDVLESKYNFIPSVIVIDYADILKPKRFRESLREQLDEIWKELAATAVSRECALITASQSNRPSFDSWAVKATHAAEDIRKLAHSDVVLTINQTEREKDASTMRVGIVAHRHEGFRENTYCLVLQQLALGQVYLDGHIMKFADVEKEQKKRKKEPQRI